MSEKTSSNIHQLDIVHPASDKLLSPSAPSSSDLGDLQSSANTSGREDQITLVEGPNMEAQDPSIDTANHEAETALPQPPLNSDSNNEHETKEPECNICGESTKGLAVHPCNACHDPYCISCLKSMFLKACKDESLMPARCCQIFQLSIVLPYLSQQEADLYRAKFEEWNSSDRVYCPVPTCSTFIPSRLIPTAVSPTPPQSTKNNFEGNAEALENERQTPNQTVIFGTGIRMEIHTPPQTPPTTDRIPITSPISQSPPTMSCPRCAAQICVSCKQLGHPQESCRADDLEPELAALLKRWKIQRCPKCRTGVKRMYGCSNIRCRCGAQWCWRCLAPICTCDDEEREDGDEGLGSDAEAEMTSGMEDLDAEDVDWEISGLNFGDEPSHAAADPWNCGRHSWQRVVLGPGATVSRGVECHKCWKEVEAAERLGDGVKVEYGELVATQSVNATANDTTSGSEALPVSENAVYECAYCGLINCPACHIADASED